MVVEEADDSPMDGEVPGVASRLEPKASNPVNHLSYEQRYSIGKLWFKYRNAFAFEFLGIGWRGSFTITDFTRGQACVPAKIRAAWWLRHEPPLPELDKQSHHEQLGRCQLSFTALQRHSENTDGVPGLLVH